MITANISFFGDDKDTYNFPKPYHSYFVIATSWQSEGSGIASAMPLSTETPPLSPSHKLVLQGGPEKAFAEIVEMIRSLPANKELTELIRRE